MGLLSFPIPSNAAERIVRLRSVTGPIFAGVKSFIVVKNVSWLRTDSIDKWNYVAETQGCELVAEFGGITAVERSGSRRKIRESP